MITACDRKLIYFIQPFIFTTGSKVPLQGSVILQCIYYVMLQARKIQQKARHIYASAIGLYMPFVKAKFHFASRSAD